jgi:hypothetical protein
MICFNPEPIYANPPFKGLAFAGSKGDGSGIQFRWYKALSPNQNFKIAYNFYYSTIKNDLFNEGVKYVIIDPDQITGELTGFTPGDIYYFAVRGALYSSDINDLTQLPIAPNGSYIYPEGLLLSNITDTDTIIPVMDADLFPPLGVIQIGSELIYYSSVDIPNNHLITTIGNRGLYGTEPRLHDVDGYDGVRYYSNPLVRYFVGFEDGNTAVVTEENKFDYPNYARTDNDGYRQRTDDMTTDLGSTEIDNEDFPMYDYSGYHRINPVDLLKGRCVGSYFGGQRYCADGYLGVGRQVRGQSIEDFNNQREEVLLSTTGEPVVIFKKDWTGITSNQYTSSKESPEYRALDSYGVDTVLGYEQYFNPRRNDRKTLIRIEPTLDDLVSKDDGLESVFLPNCWTLVVPALKDRDFFIRFNKDGTEEFRYMILNVTRNKIFLDNYGRQAFSAQRMPKTDPIYQVRYFSDNSTMPSKLLTSISGTPGPGGIPFHSHEIVISENTLSINQINQTTSYSRGHNHSVVSGQISEQLSHSHIIIPP